jgi:prepilin-type N-terminal cleavage/methylation domain-containing protein
MFLRKSRGFTIIELLVVISVILILAAIITPAVHKAKAKAKRVQCLANIRQVGQAALMYAQDYQERLPRAANRGAWYALRGIDDTKYLKYEVRKCANEPGSGAPASSANCFAVYIPTPTDSYVQDCPTTGPLVIDNTRGPAGAEDGVWNTAGSLDYHEMEGGNIFYASGTAAFLAATAPPVNYVATAGSTMTRN